MAVKRIVANIAATDPARARAFYGELLGLKLAMDHGWIATYASSQTSTAQVSIASQGGSGSAVPDLSIEVDNLDEVLAKVKSSGIPIEYGPANEPWGVRRFYIRDPYGKLLNILSHS